MCAQSDRKNVNKNYIILQITKFDIIFLNSFDVVNESICFRKVVGQIT